MTAASETSTQPVIVPSAEQQAVLDRAGNSNVLIAAAGSGKTRVLTWLYCQAHVREGIPLGALVAISFTDKAAGELRGRIADELRQQTHDREPDLSDAWIGTFHAICTRILREFAHHRGLDPAFGVIDELTALELQAEAWESVVRELLNSDPDAAGLLAQVGGPQLYGAVLNWWTARRSAGEVHPRFPTPETGADVVEAAAGALARAAEDYIGLVEELQAIRPKPLASLDTRRELGEALAAVAGQVAQRARDGKLSDWHLRDLTSQLERSKLPRRGAPMPPECEEHEALATAHETVLRRLGEFAAAPRVRMLKALTESFSRRYEERKRAQDLLDFDDLELEALQLLRDELAVRQVLTARFERILVDEFQDTNPRQAQLVDLLAGGPDWATDRAAGRPTVTVVGDPRQAIYGFRYADVKLIEAASVAIEPAGDLRLTANRRSDAAVLDAIDTAFITLVPGHEAVDPQRGAVPLPSGGARVELLLTKEEATDSWKTVDLGTLPGEPSGSQFAEARLIAVRVAELRAEEPAASIAILARTRAVLAPIAEALSEVGIPALIDGADGFWERLEVADLMAWLRVVRNPADDASLVAVCASPLVGLTTDGLAQLGLLERSRDGEPRITGLRALLDGHEGLDPDDAARLGGLIGLLEHQRQVGRSADPVALLDEVILATGYDEHVLRLINGDRRMANIVRLKRIAADVAAAGGDLTDLVQQAELQQRHGLRAPEAAIAGAGAVRLMTVHQAKGLEWDTVFVAGLGTQMRSEHPALLGDDQRLGLKLRSSPGGIARPLFDHGVLLAELQEREAEELRRVLYVALTRARERLIVSGVATWTQGGSPFNRDRSRKPPVITWLAPALVPDVEVDAFIDRAVEGPVRASNGAEVRVSTPSGTALPVEAREPELQLLPVNTGTGPRLEALPDSVAPAIAAPSVLSYSALAAHASCGLRFHAEHVLGLRSLVEPERPGAPDPNLSLLGDDGFEEAAVPERAVAPAPAAELPEVLSLFDPPIEFVAAGPESAATDVPADPAPSAAAVGVLVHELLEVLPPSSSGAALDQALARRSGALGPEWATHPEALDRVRQLVRAAHASPVVQELWAGREPRRELNFTIAVGAAGRLITGVIDAWQFQPGGGALVVDYKTDRVSANDDLEAKTSRRYHLQRAAYALAALRSGAPSVRVVHVFLAGEGTPSATRVATTADIPELDRELATAAAAVHAGDAQATATPDRWLCDGCPARGTFCGWPEATTRRSATDPPPPRDRWQGDPAGLAG